MIPVEYYTSVYYTVLSLCVLFIVLPIFKYAHLEQLSKSILIFDSVIILTVVIGFIGLRDPYGHWDYFGDTRAYTYQFNDILKGITPEKIKDYGFYVFTWLLAKTKSLELYYLACAIVYVVVPYKAFKSWFKHKAVFALLLYVVSMSFWGYGINGVRNGLATSLLLYAFSISNRKWLFYAMVIIAISFHKSVVLPAVVFIFLSKFNNTSLLIKLWFLTIIFSFFFGSKLSVFFENNLSVFNAIDERGSTYFTGKAGDVVLETGFRIDFVLYSGFAILLGYYYYYFKKRFNNVFYKRIFHTYIITNSIWILFMYAAFTNRIAYLSWFLMPLVLIYPLLKNKLFKKQNKLIAYLIMGSLFFTLLLYSR